MAISRYKVVTPNRESFFANRTWSIRYDKGSTVIGRNGTGVFVFETRDDAEKYSSRFSFRAGKIIRVIPIGKGFKPKYRPTCYSDNVIEKFWEDINSTKRGCNDRSRLANILRIAQHQITSNDGTIIYPAVRVME